MLHRSGPLGPPGTDVRFAVTGRAGGVSAAPYDSLDLGDHVGDDAHAVATNRARVAAHLGLDRLAFMRQVHGREVAEVTDADAGEAPAADALVTRSPDVGLVVLVADCVPVLLAAPGDDGPVAAVAHAGRRGVQAGVVTATVAAMRDLGARVEGARAVVGPSVCGACYEVPVEVQAEVVAVAPAALATSRAGTPSLELRAAVLAELGAAGIDDVRTDRACTLEDVGFFSHRRDGVTGRFAGVAWIAS